MKPWALQTCQALKIQLQSKSASNPLNLLKNRLLLPSLRVRKTGTGKHGFKQVCQEYQQWLLVGTACGPESKQGNGLSATVTRRMFLKLESPNSPKFWGLTSHFLPAAMPMRIYCSCYLANTTSAQETLIPNSVTVLDSEKESTEELDPPNTPCLSKIKHVREREDPEDKTPNTYRIAKSVSLWLTVGYLRGATVVAPNLHFGC